MNRPNDVDCMHIDAGNGDDQVAGTCRKNKRGETEKHGPLSLGCPGFDRLLRDLDASVRGGHYLAGADLVEQRLDDMDAAAFAVSMLKLLYAGKKVGAFSAEVRERAVTYAKALLVLRPDLPSARWVVARWGAE